MKSLGTKERNHTALHVLHKWHDSLDSDQLNDLAPSVPVNIFSVIASELLWGACSVLIMAEVGLESMTSRSRVLFAALFAEPTHET